MLATKKRIHQLSSSSSETKGSQVSSFAVKYMKKMGWEEGQGECINDFEIPMIVMGILF